MSSIDGASTLESFSSTGEAATGSAFAAKMASWSVKKRLISGPGMLRVGAKTIATI